MEIERALSAEERDYGLSFAEALDGCLHSAVIAINPDGVITAFNARAEQLTRLPATDALNHSLDILPAPIRAAIQEVLSSATPIDGREIHAADDTLRLSAYPAPDRTGTPGAIVLLSDLGPIQRLESKMRQLDRLASVGALSASMAHEIKNAMVAIRTFVDLLVRQNQESELAPIVGREMRRIDSIVSQMLRLAGPARPTFAPLRVHSLLEHALRLVQHQLEARQLRFACDFLARTDLIRGDEYQLQQAVLNLIFNAIEAMGPDGELTIRTRTTSSPAAIRISISDTGSGIAPENLGRLFDAFFTTKQHGTGLGLAITRRIVQEHNGEITVDSILNKGTTFHLTLPT